MENIFWLLRTYLRLETEKLRQHGARLEFIGRRDRLPPLLLREIARAEYATAESQRLHLRIAVDYSSRDAIARAIAGVSAALPLELSGCRARRIQPSGTALWRYSGSPRAPRLVRDGGER